MNAAARPLARALLLALLAACGGGAKSAHKPFIETPLQPPPDTGTCRADEEDPLGSGSCEPEPDIEVVGAIPKDSIHRVVRENFEEIRTCYETLLLGDPTLRGRVLARFKVGIDGTVSDATATGVHPDLERCVADKIRKFRFPKPDGAATVEVTYPLMFKPG